MYVSSKLMLPSIDYEQQGKKLIKTIPAPFWFLDETVKFCTWYYKILFCNLLLKDDAWGI